LDLANSILWLLVSASIAYDIYAPGDYGGTLMACWQCLQDGALHGARASAVTWGVEGACLDFYDAALWILWFALV
jgi:hypothetical protein